MIASISRRVSHDSDIFRPISSWLIIPFENDIFMNFKNIITEWKLETNILQYIINITLSSLETSKHGSNRQILSTIRPLQTELTLTINITGSDSYILN